MTTYVQARDSIATLLASDFSANLPDLPVFWENTLEVDLDTVGDTFMRVLIDFDEAMKMTELGAPEHRVHGEVIFTVLTKEGKGTRHVLVLFDHITNVVKYCNTSKVQFQTPMPGRKDGRDGWLSFDLRAPFYFDTLAWA